MEGTGNHQCTEYRRKDIAGGPYEKGGLFFSFPVIFDQQKDQSVGQGTDHADLCAPGTGQDDIDQLDEAVGGRYGTQNSAGKAAHQIDHAPDYQKGYKSAQIWVDKDSEKPVVVKTLPDQAAIHGDAVARNKNILPDRHGRGNSPDQSAEGKEQGEPAVVLLSGEQLSHGGKEPHLNNEPHKGGQIAGYSVLVIQGGGDGGTQDKDSIDWITFHFPKTVVEKEINGK